MDGHVKIWGRVSDQEPHHSPFDPPLPSSVPLHHSLFPFSLLLYAVFLILFFYGHVIHFGPRNTSTQ